MPQIRLFRYIYKKLHINFIHGHLIVIAIVNEILVFPIYIPIDYK